MPLPTLETMRTSALNALTSLIATPNPIALLSQPTTSPTDLPLALTLLLIPTVYLLGHVSGNVSWVDRVWTTWPLLCTVCYGGWALLNPTAGSLQMGPSVVRLGLAFVVQCIWSARLTWHTARRGLYNLKAEDYRYKVLRKLVPPAIFELVHIVAVAIAQPLLIFVMTLPLSQLLQPASNLTSGPSFPGFATIRFSSVKAYLPAHLRGAPPATPVLHEGDALIFVIILAAIWLEAAGDAAMYAFQEGKYAEIASEARGEAERELGRSSSDVTSRTAVSAKSESESNSNANPNFKSTSNPNSTSTTSSNPNLTHQAQGTWKYEPPAPVPTATIPLHFRPGFPTAGLHGLVRHPNFAGEQIFWAGLGYLAVGAARVVDLEACLAGSFLLSLLFCGSTALTEWITTRRYPPYAAYTRLVGKFALQETVLKDLWHAAVGDRERWVLIVNGDTGGTAKRKTSSG